MNGNLYSQSNMSQVDMVLNHLINYGKITPEESINLYNIKYFLIYFDKKLILDLV